MVEVQQINLGSPTLLEFRGPDALRFLNGQLTQDVRRVVGQKISLPSCVTDVKGKLQFRVTVMEADDGVFWVSGLADWAEMLEARLTRYLIADDVEVIDLTGSYHLAHLIGTVPDAPLPVIARISDRYGVSGIDWWIPSSQSHMIPEIPEFDAAVLESLRIANGVPAWGPELQEGLLPPEALLDLSDCSYNKGCYIGQEVISRIKSAGKVNKRLTRLLCDSQAVLSPGPLQNGAGDLTSVSPIARGAVRDALAYIKRGATDLSITAADGHAHALTRREV